MKPPIQYFGAKINLADQIVAWMPPHRGYIEPFAGSLSVLLAKPPSKVEVVNDLDHRLMTFWRVLRDRGEDLVRLAELTPHSRAELESAMLLDAEDDLHLAHQVWVLLTQGRSRTLARTGWRFYSDPGGTSSSFQQYMAAYRSRLGPAIDRLRDVSLECRPALDVITQYGAAEDNLLYVDPPYLATTRRAGRYSFEMGAESDHRELAEALSQCSARVMLSGYRSALYDDLYSAWRRVEMSAYTGNSSEGERVEVLWLNWDDDDLLVQLDRAGVAA